MPSLLKTVFWTVAVLAGVGATLWGLGRIFRRSRLSPNLGPVRLLARRSLENGQRVYVIEFGRRILLVGATKDRLEILERITDPDESALIRSQAFPAQFEKVLEQKETEKAPDEMEAILSEIGGIKETVGKWRQS